MPAKILLVYYSRTGITKKVALALQEKLICDLEEIISVKNRSGVMGYFLSGKEATQKKAADIQLTSKNPADYDLVIIGTPIWSWNLSSTVRAYLEQNADKLKRLAGFCTMGGSGDKMAFSETEKICGSKLLASVSFLSKEVAAEKFEEKLEKFVGEIKSI